MRRWTILKLKVLFIHYVYLIRSVNDPSQTYIGYSKDLKSRLEAHNKGYSPHTSQHSPWQLETYLAFNTKKQALEFEAYLKTGSDKAFAQKRLWN